MYLNELTNYLLIAIGMTRRRAQMWSCPPCWKGNRVWEAIGPNRAPGSQPKCDYEPQKSLSPCLSTWCALSFHQATVPKGSFDSNIPGKVWKHSLFLYFLIFSKHHTWTDTFWQTHTLMHIYTHNLTLGHIPHSCGLWCLSLTHPVLVVHSCGHTLRLAWSFSLPCPSYSHTPTALHASSSAQTGLCPSSHLDKYSHRHTHTLTHSTPLGMCTQTHLHTHLWIYFQASSHTHKTRQWPGKVTHTRQSLAWWPAQQ